MDKHGENFEAMAKDHTNYYQETAAQLRKQIERLKNIPQQWVAYLKSR
ncbi:Nucleolar protein 16, partial [Orchesella cincta]